ncbi:MAG TPA: histidine kinase [Terriglobales bacterium]
MFRSAQSRFPSYWQLQFIGWIGLYALSIVGSIPDTKHPWAYRADTVAIVLMFLGSLLLRPVCRSMVRGALPWFPYEVRAFAWSALIGVAGAFALEMSFDGFSRIYWIDIADNSVQFTVVLFLWCSLYFSIKQWKQSIEERERLLRAESELREARLSALRYQLNPHFLFNSLNAVSTLVLEGNAPAATRMLAQIGELLRTTLDGQTEPEITLAQEIAFTEQYLAIEQTRLGARLRVEVNVSHETIDALVPSMLLQPLVENAVRHGIAPLVQGGTIRISSRLGDDRLQIGVFNSGAFRRPSSEPSQAKGSVGIRNTVERLKTMYGADHSFRLEWPLSGGCEVTIELPFRPAPQEQEVVACVP